ncbi:MAG TPA: hypothetical protein VE130_16650 [Nitrososphaeraceae archaeon]|nr:hypothetical protein [Nitrososphaeraceae archaeon]
MKLEKSISNLAKKLDSFDDLITASNNKTGLRYWKHKSIIPIDEWITIRDTSYALDYFPDDFDLGWTHMPRNELEKEEQEQNVKKWDSDFIELMEYTKNPNYGKMKCFHCLLNPAGDDPIFIGINRLVAKGLTNGEQDPLPYPCEVVNRFQCPYERNNNVKRAVFDVENLFKLEKMAFVIEISLAVAEKEDSRIRVRNKKELFNALTDKDMLTKILEQGSEAEASEDIGTYLVENRDNILDYFMKLKDKVDIEELRFHSI